MSVIERPEIGAWCVHTACTVDIRNSLLSPSSVSERQATILVSGVMSDFRLDSNRLWLVLWKNTSKNPSICQEGTGSLPYSIQWTIFGVLVDIGHIWGDQDHCQWCVRGVEVRFHLLGSTLEFDAIFVCFFMIPWLQGL